jgi:hypothetical protein
MLVSHSTISFAEAIMGRMFKLLCGITLLVVLAPVTAGSDLAAQTPSPRPWTVTAAFTWLRTGGACGVVYVPELAIRRDFGSQWGLELRASLPVLDVDRGTDDGAGAIDLGPTLSFKTEQTEFGLTAGATAFLVGDGGELVDGGIGGFVGGHATAWFGANVGGTLGANVRVSGRGDTYPSLSAGLAFRF